MGPKAVRIEGDILTYLTKSKAALENLKQQERKRNFTCLKSKGIHPRSRREIYLEQIDNVNKDLQVYATFYLVNLGHSTLLSSYSQLFLLFYPL